MPLFWAVVTPQGHNCSITILKGGRVNECRCGLKGLDSGVGQWGTPLPCAHNRR